ncbi:MAG: DUF4349 domain-containing protein, partial [Clostridiales bacterium]
TSSAGIESPYQAAPMAIPAETPAAFDGEMAVADRSAENDSGTDVAEKLISPNLSALPMMERKIIKDVHLRLEVEDFNVAYQKLSDMAVKFGGYTVSGQVYNNVNAIADSGYVELRVDAASLDTVLAAIAEIGQISEQNFSTDDVTSEYYDIQSRLDQYRAQEERLMELYQEADTITDLIQLEQELTRVQVEVDSLEGSIRYYDQMTALSLVAVDIYTPDKYASAVKQQGFSGFWQDVQQAFWNGLNGTVDVAASVLLFCVRITPLLLFILAVGIWLMLRHRRKKKQV